VVLLCDAVARMPQDHGLLWTATRRSGLQRALRGIHSHQSTGAKASLVSNHLSINHHGNIPARAQKLHDPLAFLCQSRPPRLSVRVLFESS
jgi:hypothetical protein